MTFEYSFADECHVIKETVTKVHILCNELSEVINTFIKNEVFADIGDRMVIECKKHHTRLELNTALTYFGKPMKHVDGELFNVSYDGTLKPT